MKQLIIIITMFFFAYNICAQNFNCSYNVKKAPGITEAGNYSHTNWVTFAGGSIEDNSQVIVTAGNEIHITPNPLTGAFTADSQSGSVFLAYIAECENFEPEALIECSDISQQLIQEQYPGRDNPGQTDVQGVEYSDLAYHPNKKILFMPLDDAIKNQPNEMIYVEGQIWHAIRAYYIEDDVEYIVTLNNMPGDFILHSGDADFEGMTHLVGDYFALVDEATRVVYFLEYSDAQKQLNYISSVDLSDEIDDSIVSNLNRGIEGISYNRYEQKLYLVTEGNHRKAEIDYDTGEILEPSGYWSDIIIFEFDLIANDDLSDLNSAQLMKANELNLSNKLISLNNQDNFNDASAIYHLSKVFLEGSKGADRFLLLSHESQSIIEMDMQGRFYGLEMKVLDEPQAEGVVFIPIDNTLRVVVSSEGRKFRFNNGQITSGYTAKINQYINTCAEEVSSKITQHVSNYNAISVSPNPIFDQSIISYNLDNSTKISVHITDVLGKQITALVDAEQQQAGINELTFDASDLPAGIYFCTVQTDDKVHTQKLVKAN